MGDSSAGVSNMSGNRKRELPSFWLPSMCPDAKKSKLVKPDKTVYCPMSGKPLKVKDLIDVKWTEVKDPDNKKSMISRDERYQCAVTGDTLYNSTPCAVLRTSGHVVTLECVEKIIKKDWTHPLRTDSRGEGHHQDCQGSNWLQCFRPSACGREPQTNECYIL